MGKYKLSNTYQMKSYLRLSSANTANRYSSDLFDISIVDNPLKNIFTISKS